MVFDGKLEQEEDYKVKIDLFYYSNTLDQKLIFVYDVYQILDLYENLDKSVSKKRRFAPEWRNNGYFTGSGRRCSGSARRNELDKYFAYVCRCDWSNVVFLYAPPE